VTSDGFVVVDGLDIVDSPLVDVADILNARVLLESNFGVEYSNEKFNNLFQILIDDGWSRYRFLRTLAWFRKKQKYPAWTEADWYSYSIPVHTYGWCLQMVNKGHDWKTEIESYKLPNGTRVYKFIDGEVLPFERTTYNNKPTTQQPTEEIDHV
jgi:hypothetical protein